MLNHHLNYTAESSPNSFLHNSEWVELKDPRIFFSEFPLDLVPVLQQEKEDLEHDFKVLQDENSKLEKTVSILQKRIDDYVGKVQLQLDELTEDIEL